MHQPRSVAERLDDAVDHVLGGLASPMASAAAGVGPDARPLVQLAEQLRAALVPLPAAQRFEARLGARLGGATPRDPLTWGDPVTWALSHPGRLIVTGAVGSAVGVGVTAYAVWRSSRRGPTHRLLHR